MRRSAATAILVVVMTTAASALAGSDDAAAEALFLEGRKLFVAGNYDAACAKFAASQKLAPGPGTLLNLADCHEHAGRIATAWVTFREAIEAARTMHRPDREKFARDRAAELEPKLPRITITVDRAANPGIVVKKDGLALDDAALGMALPVDPGDHVIDAQADGRTSFRRSVTVAVGQSETVEIPTLSTVDRSPPPAATTATTEAPKSVGAMSALPWITGSVAIAAAGVGTAFGLVARNNWEDAQSGPHCRGTICDPIGGEQANDARIYGNVSTVAFVVSGLALAATVILIVAKVR